VLQRNGATENELGTSVPDAVLHLPEGCCLPFFGANAVVPLRPVGACPTRKYQSLYLVIGDKHAPR
jgi:hypothetical protein